MSERGRTQRRPSLRWLTSRQVHKSDLESQSSCQGKPGEEYSKHELGTSRWSIDYNSNPHISLLWHWGMNMRREKDEDKYQAIG